MKWRIATNGVALVIAISSTSIVSAATFDSKSAEVSQSKLVNADARSILSSIKVENEYQTGYKRKLFIHWADLDGNGCDTREEVLMRDSVSKPQVDSYRCYVVAGDWVSPYDGAKLGDRGDVDIDHVVALKEAWDSGAWAWSESQRKAYANDMTDSRTLIAVTDRVNVSKSDKDPSNWMPPLRSYWCTYLGDWISVKARWGLSMDQSEFGRIKNLLTASCATATVAPWGTAPASSSKSATTPITEDTIPVVVSVTTLAPVATAAPVAVTGGREVAPVRCKKAESGQTGQYKGVPYVCSDQRKDGTAYAAGYYMWRPA